MSYFTFKNIRYFLFCVLFFETFKFKFNKEEQKAVQIINNSNEDPNSSFLPQTNFRDLVLFMDSQGFFQLNNSYENDEETSNNGESLQQLRQILTNITVIWTSQEGSPFSHSVIMKNQAGPSSLLSVHIALLELIQSLTWLQAPSDASTINEISLIQYCFTPCGKDQFPSLTRITLSKKGDVQVEKQFDVTTIRSAGKLGSNHFASLSSYIIKKDILLLDKIYGFSTENETNGYITHITWGPFKDSKIIADWGQNGPKDLIQFESDIIKVLDSVTWEDQYDWFIINSVVVSFGITIAIIGFFVFLHTLYRRKERKQVVDDEEPILTSKN